MAACRSFAERLEDFVTMLLRFWKLSFQTEPATFATVHEFETFFLSDPLQVPVRPDFTGNAVLETPLNTVRRSKDNVEVPAVHRPTRLFGCEMLVRIRDPPIVLFFEFILDRVWRWVSPKPK